MKGRRTRVGTDRYRLCFHWRLRINRWGTSGISDDGYDFQIGSGVLNNDMSAETESFSEGLLEYPQYTRPAIWRDEAVPEVLLSYHHKKLQEWYRRESVIRTAKRRPDMLMQAQLSEEEKELAEQYAELE